MIKKLLDFTKKHKITVFILILTLFAIGYLLYQEIPTKNEETSYETAEVTKTNLETIVTVNGQVGDANQINITPEASGVITKIGVSEGEEVYLGQFIAQIDSTDLENDIYQAQLALESAQVKLEQLNEDPDQDNITKSENDLITAQNNLTALKLTQEHVLEETEEDLENARENRSDLDEDDSNYDSNYQNYTTQIKDAKRKLEEYDLSHPLKIQEAQNNIKEKENALAEAKKGTDQKDITLQGITIKEKQAKLQDLINQRSNYYITARKAGIIASLNIIEGEFISSGGNNSFLATIISTSKTAEVTINEIDIINIVIGQKTNISFDAIEDLELTGTVSKIDLIGTADQGVVYHTVTIDFNDQDERVRNGMTVNVDIITQSKEDILTIPSKAIKTNAQTEYVEILRKNNLEQIEIETGITDDINVEIISGLKEGEEVITKIITLEETKETGEDEEEESRSLFSVPGTGGGRNK